MPNSRNVMANMKAFAELKRNAFDLRNGHIYSQKCGEIIPIKAVHTIPGDYFDCNITDQNISFPMNTAAFMGARKEITTYFVPYNHVYSLFNQLQATRPDPKTSALVESNRVEEARISLFGLYYPLIWQFWAYAAYEYWIPMRVRQAYQNEYGSQYDESCYEVSLTEARTNFLNSSTFDINNFTHGSVSFSMKAWIYDDAVVSSSVEFDSFSYSNIFDLLPLQGTDEMDVAESYYSVNDNIPVARPMKSYCLDIVGRFRIYSWVRKLDMLDYVNLYPIFRSAETFLMKHTDINEYVQSGYSQVVFSFLCQNILRLSLSNYYTPNNYPDSYTPQFQYVNLYAILAYNKVFYDYFRNTYYDLKYRSRNYNIDFAIKEGGYIPVIHPSDMDIRFLDVEYHQWKKDIITGVLPNAQYGAVSGITIDTNRVDLTGAFVSGVSALNNSYVTSAGGFLSAYGSAAISNGELLREGDSPSSAYHTHNINSPIDTSHAELSIVDAFDVLQLKRAEMLQAYRQMLMRNGNRTIDIFKGLYGDAPASEDDNSPRFVDAFGSTLFVDTVVSTADTAQQDSTKGALGDLGARAVINGGGKFKFKTSDFGVLLFLGYIVPDAVYPSFGLSPANRALDPETHFIPFFQNLGFTPILRSDFNKFYRESGVDLQTRGFAPSYYDKKTDIDRAHGNFVALPKENMVVSATNVFGNPTVLAIDDFVGSFNHWTPLRTDAVVSQKDTLQLLYISPSYWDNVFIQKAGADYDTDHFVVNTRIFIDSVRKLSKLGLPNF